MFGPFKELLGRLINSPELPWVTCVVADCGMVFGAQGAREMGIKEVQLWTASACAFMGYLHYREFIARGIVPLKDDSYLTNGTLEKTIDWIPGMKGIQYKDIPSFVRTTDVNEIMFDFLGKETHNCLHTSAIIFNTFNALEQEVLDAFVAKFNYNNIYTIGPLLLLERHIPKSHHEVNALSSSLWKPNFKVFEWPDKKEPNSVVYVNYGSITVMTKEHFNEFAWGLANSKHPFLWIIRPDVTMGEPAHLPDEIKDRGLLASWYTQDLVLAHASVGAFMTHCGWNSSSESISEGVPTICWPFFADQQTNCRYLCKEWGMGLEINEDVKRNEVEALVRELMGEGKGKKMRMKAKEWKTKAIEATDIGGSSYENYGRFVKEIFNEESLKELHDALVATKPIDEQRGKKVQSLGLLSAWLPWIAVEEKNADYVAANLFDREIK
ncbi:hypothetical protein LguiB_016661 [Lonicera macranthoides]